LPVDSLPSDRGPRSCPSRAGRAGLVRASTWRSSRHVRGRDNLIVEGGLDFRVIVSKYNDGLIKERCRRAARTNHAQLVWGLFRVPHRFFAPPVWVSKLTGVIVVDTHSQLDAGCVCSSRGQRGRGYRYAALNRSTHMTTATIGPDLMDRLRSATRDDHDDTEAIPFSSAMVNEQLPRAVFVQHLQAMRLVHSALEQALADSTDPAVQVIWSDDLAKAPLLRRDLDALGPVELTPATARATQSFVDDISDTAEDQPTALLGFLYVLEGSTLGATILRKHLMAMYDIDETCGLAYYWPYGNQVMPHWKQFKAQMNAAPIGTDQHDAIIEAARRAFRHIGAILRTLTAELDLESTAREQDGSAE